MLLCEKYYRRLKEKKKVLVTRSGRRYIGNTALLVGYIYKKSTSLDRGYIRIKP